MAKDFNYNRAKDPAINDTPINLVPLGAESAGTPAAFAAGEAGTTGITLLNYTADADESGGADVQEICRFVITPVLDASTGAISWSVVFTPTKGGGTDGTPQSVSFSHDEDIDAWQTAAGRARQA